MTMRDVAELAGVSTPTVSKVLVGNLEISGVTRARVLQAMERTGYDARFVKRQPKGSIALVIDGIDSLWALKVVQGTEGAAASLGYSVVVSSTHHGTVGPRDWLRRILQQRPDGVVAALTKLNPETLRSLRSLRSLGMPVVVVEPVRGFDPSVPTISATNWLGGLTATEHLLALGHRRIGIITGPEEVLSSQERLDGHLAALRRHKVPVAEELIRRGDFLVGGGRAASAELLKLKPPPSAVFAANDLHAAGVYEEAACRSLRIPEDLSVVGFDDVALCEFLSPKLMTVRLPIIEMADQAVKLVHELVGTRKTWEGPMIQLSTTLIVRSSTGPATKPRNGCGRAMSRRDRC
jgi:DNA-binding LacI/PurR family transcriptional regulator